VSTPREKVAIAIILARGGSKGVPRKNAAPIAGKPCIAWTIEAAQRAQTVGHVAVSTDDAELAAIAGQARATVINRPAALATDTARVDDAARHAVDSAASSLGLPAPASLPVVILYANVPVRPPGLIDRAVRLMLETGCDSVQSYAPVGKFHPWWMARVDADSGRVRPWEGEVLNHGVFRRQDLPPAFVPDGGVLVVSCRALFGEIPGVPDGPHAFFGKDRRGIATSEGEVVDIDSPTDLLVADAILRGQESHHRGTEAQRKE
jgi:N-acylneuraminate cytidylyltransferase